MKSVALAAAAIAFTMPLLADDLHTIVDDAWSGADGFHFSGRLTEIRRAPHKDAGGWHAFYRHTRMLFTSGEEGAVTWRVGSLEWTVRADDHGYWELTSNMPLGLAPGWYDIETEPPASSVAGLLVHDPRNTFGIISDIDDTILVSEVLSRRRLLHNSLVVPPENRVAVSGMATLYARLARKNPEPALTPIFYVSSSPRQLTNNLRLFLQLNGFPRGVLVLKEISTERGDSLLDSRTYKKQRIERILAAYPSVRFALIGDDGEHDPEIYAGIAARFPAQIEGVWIRRVRTSGGAATYPDQRDLAELLADAPPK